MLMGAVQDPIKGHEKTTPGMAFDELYPRKVDEHLATMTINIGPDGLLLSERNVTKESACLLPGKSFGVEIDCPGCLGCYAPVIAIIRGGGIRLNPANMGADQSKEWMVNIKLISDPNLDNADACQRHCETTTGCEFWEFEWERSIQSHYAECYLKADFGKLGTQACNLNLAKKYVQWPVVDRLHGDLGSFPARGPGWHGVAGHVNCSQPKGPVTRAAEKFPHLFSAQVSAHTTLARQSLITRATHIPCSLSVWRRSSPSLPAGCWSAVSKKR